MAERSQYQYQPVTGPVWREPVADRLAWLPAGQQPQRTLPRAGVAPFAQPPFEALYDPRRLEWIPQGQQPARALARAVVDWSVYPPRVISPGYDPAGLEWLTPPAAPTRATARTVVDGSVYPPRVAGYDPSALDWLGYLIAPPRLPETRRAEFAQPPFDALYKPDGLQWALPATYPARGLQAGRPGFAWVPLYEPANLEWAPQWRPIVRNLPRSAIDYTVGPLQFAAPAYDPSRVEWLPSGQQPRAAVERRIEGPFVQPPFEALYRPAGLDWAPNASPPIRIAEGRSRDYTVAPPIQPTIVAYDPRGLEWTPSQQQPLRSAAGGGRDHTIAPPIQPTLAAYDPRGMEWVPNAVAPQIVVPRSLASIASVLVFGDATPVEEARSVFGGVWPWNRLRAIEQERDREFERERLEKEAAQALAAAEAAEQQKIEPALKKRERRTPSSDRHLAPLDRLTGFAAVQPAELARAEPAQAEQGLPSSLGAVAQAAAEMIRLQIAVGAMEQAQQVAQAAEDAEAGEVMALFFMLED